MKKKILFMLISMNVGGTERAFLNLLHELPKEEYDITVLLLQKKGGFLKNLPPHVKVKEMDDFPQVGRNISYHPINKIKRHVSERQYKQAFSLFTLHLFMNITKDRRIMFKKVFKNIPVQQEEYDIAVAYAGPMDIITYYIATRVKAKEKYQWIHFDVNEIGFDERFARRMYPYFDQIYVVSRTATKYLQEKLPTLRNKIATKTNTLSAQEITRLANEEDVFSQSSTIRIVTVARVSKEKGPDIAVRTLSDLKKQGYNVRWHWIGGGEWTAYIQELIKEHRLEDSFILEGLKSNPYPYMHQSDIYVQPSRHEGYCLTLAEARLLEKPIVTTATAGGKEQIRHGKTGFISDINELTLAKHIEKLINDQALRKQLSDALQRENVEQDTTVHFKRANIHDEGHLSKKQSTI